MPPHANYHEFCEVAQNLFRDFVTGRIDIKDFTVKDIKKMDTYKHVGMNNLGKLVKGSVEKARTYLGNGNCEYFFIFIFFYFSNFFLFTVPPEFADLIDRIRKGEFGEFEDQDFNPVSTTDADGPNTFLGIESADSPSDVTGTGTDLVGPSPSKRQKFTFSDVKCKVSDSPVSADSLAGFKSLVPWVIPAGAFFCMIRVVVSPRHPTISPEVTFSDDGWELIVKVTRPDLFFRSDALLPGFDSRKNPNLFSQAIDGFFNENFNHKAGLKELLADEFKIKLPFESDKCLYDYNHKLTMRPIYIQSKSVPGICFLVAIVKAVEKGEDKAVFTEMETHELD